MVITPPSGAQLHNVAVPSVLFDGWWSVECHVSQSSMTQLAQEPKNPVAGYGNDALEYLPPCSHTHADMLREGTPPEVCARRDSKRVADTCGTHHGRALPLHHALHGSSNLWCVTTATDSMCFVPPSFTLPDGSAYNHSGVHLCHQLFRIFHARQADPLHGAVESRESVFHSHAPSVFLESVPWRRLVDIGTCGMSDTFPPVSVA